MFLFILHKYHCYKRPVAVKILLQQFHHHYIGILGMIGSSLVFYPYTYHTTPHSFVLMYLLRNGSISCVLFANHLAARFRSPTLYGEAENRKSIISF